MIALDQLLHAINNFRRDFEPPLTSSGYPNCRFTTDKEPTMYLATQQQNRQTVALIRLSDNALGR